MPIVVEKSKSGIDFPTEAPGENFLVWTFSAHLRIALRNLKSIETALAGIDYPTDGPIDLSRDFQVAVDVFGNRFPINK